MCLSAVLGLGYIVFLLSFILHIVLLQIHLGFICPKTYVPPPACYLLEIHSGLMTPHLARRVEASSSSSVWLLVIIYMGETQYLYN